MKGRTEISTSQFIWMLVSIIASFTGSFVPSILIQTAGSDAWITLAVACVLDIGLAGVYAYMGLRFPGATFVTYAEETLGPWLGKPVALMFPCFFLFVSCMLLHTISNMITSLFLPGTPGPVITLATLAVVAYGARAGLETVARAAEMLGPLFVIAGLAGTLVVTPHIRAEFIMRPLAHGPGPVLAAVPLALSVMAICIVMATFQAHHNEPHRSWFAKSVAVTTGAALIAVITTGAMALFGVEQAGSTRYPDLALAKVITIGEFVERVEILWVVVAVGAGILSLSILLWNIASELALVFGLQESRPLVAPLAGLMLPLSFLMFAGQVDAEAFIRSDFPVYALSVETGLEVLVWLVALARGKRGRGQSSPRKDRPEWVPPN